ncbi:MAG: type IX secretion system membrane protein PorP/SprF [Alphaproteobacteria bacterium]|nr:type IX secretion system membrane protein PorP/SprF [Alphaproteobacteria bacterium]
MFKLNIKVVASVFLLLLSFLSKSQLREVYENTQFTHSALFNPANIAIDPTVNLNVTAFTFQPQSKSIEGLYSSFSALVYKSIGKGGFIGLLYDNNQNGPFKQNNFAFKYAYLVQLNAKMDVGIGGSVGGKNSRINVAEITDNFDPNYNTNAANDPVIVEFNSTPIQIYTDLGVNFRLSGLRIQAVLFNITKGANSNQETEPKYYGSIEYDLQLEKLGLRFFGGIVGYDDKVKSNKIIAGARVLYNPVGVSFYYNTQGKITVNVDIPLIKSLAFDVGYSFGPYYNNEVYGDKGNISFGAKYTLFKK